MNSPARQVACLGSRSTPLVLLGKLARPAFAVGAHPDSVAPGSSKLSSAESSSPEMSPGFVVFVTDSLLLFSLWGPVRSALSLGIRFSGYRFVLASLEVACVATGCFAAGFFAAGFVEVDFFGCFVDVALSVDLSAATVRWGHAWQASAPVNGSRQQWERWVRHAI
ncbi:hypothetical protein PR001_g2965 [Phytophthora rubi]|uniref:Uncharacterized protein n=1 Tax=Phytophthora rubi TaxID=129364 RepID=A0A6A3P2Z3_9STRA|nr:hypothetical protein PR001_g2965 [Phytophthora rubi]